MFSFGSKNPNDITVNNPTLRTLSNGYVIIYIYIYKDINKVCIYIYIYIY